MKHRGKNIARKIASIVLASATAMSIIPVSSVMAADVNEAKVNGTEYSTIGKAWEKVKDGGTIDILKDCKPSSRLVVNEGKSVTVNMNGHSVNRHLASLDSGESKKNGEVFCVNDEATLTINGGDKTIKHGGYVAASDNEDGVWYEQANNDQTPIYGGVIVGGYSTNGAGGIHMKKKSNVTLNDVTIAGNKADYWGGDGNGGGVAMNGSNSSLTLNNSKIIYNYAESDGGGVYANAGYNNITLNNNSEISHNWAEDDYGGGIYLDDDHSKVVLNEGCKINNNKATYGGGIYCADDYMTIKMNGEGEKEPEISYNIATKKGGGIYFYYSKVSVKGGKFANNYSGGGGGGAIYLEHYSNRVIKDSAVIANVTFTGNSGEGDGGAIHSEQEYVSIDSCKITNNHAKDHGGGIYIYNDDNSISSSTITGNSANKGGGGVYADSSEIVALGGKLIIKDNTVNGNTNNFELKKEISSSPSSGSQVGITKEKCGEIGTAGHYAQNVFFSDVKGRHLEWDDGDRKLYLKEGEKDTKVDSASADTTEVTKDGNTVLKGTFSYPSIEESAKDMDGTFYYTDAYFQNPGTYNKHLATMSLCMAMSAFNSNVGNDNQDGTDYVLKSKNIVKLLSDIGVGRDNIYLSNTYTVKPGTGTIGVAIGQKGLDDAGHILVPIAVRGAGYESEWTSNVTIGHDTKYGEHAGFADAADQVFAQVKSYISNYNLEQAVREGKVKFWVTGYSRAGATANLTARRLIDEYGTNNEVYAYCMEAPQGAISDTNNKSKYGIIHNCINYTDPVPKVAPSFMNFMRYGTDEIFNKPNTDTSGVKKQLHAVAPDLAYDSYYAIATIDLFHATVDSIASGKNPNMIQPVPNVYIKDAAPKDAGQYTDGLINKLKEWVINDRSAFTEVNTKVDLRDNTSLEQVSFEKSLQLVMPIVFSKSDKELNELIEVASERANDLSMFSIYKGPILGKWEKQDVATKKKWIWNELWYKVVETKEGNGISTKLTSKELTDLKTAWPTLLDTVFTFVSKDYNYTGWVSGWYVTSYDYTVSGLNVLGTLVYNSSSLMQAHYPEINYAWLRSMDSYYNDDTTPIKVSNDKTPTVVYELDKETYEGDQTLKLNTKDSAEKAGIYYRLTTKVAGGTETTSSWMPYNNGITLPVVTDSDGTQKSVTYKVETRAAYCNNKSETTSKTYTINPVIRHSVKVVDANASADVEVLQTYNYAQGEKVTINVTEQTGKFFAGWSSDDITLKEDEQGKKTITFTMPNKDVVLNATYKKLIDTVEVTNLQNPVAGQAFVSSAESALKGDSEEVEAQTSCNVIWTTINANEEHENVKTQKAGYNTAYEAILVLRPEEGVREFADKMNVSVNGNSIGEQRVTPQADGSIWVYCGANTTRKAKFQNAQAIAITAKTGTQISDLGLPSNILINTEDGPKIANITNTGWTCERYTPESAGTYTFSADIDLKACDIDPADETTKAVATAQVTLEPKAKAVTPVLSKKSVTPGTYKEKQNIYLETTTPGATIMYTVNGGDEETYNSETGIELTIPENAESGKEKSYTISAYAKADGMDNSDFVTYTYKIVKPYTVTISYKDTGLSGWKKEATSTTYLPGEVANIVAPEESDEQFASWEESNGSLINDTNRTSKIIKVDSINKDINLTAVYNPVVKAVNLTIPVPVTGEKLAKTVSACTATITETYDVLNQFKLAIPITWTPEGNDGTASAYQSYSAKMSMSMDNEKAKFFVSNQLALIVKDATSQSWAIEQEAGKDVLVVYATFAPTAKVKAVSVAQPDSVQVGHGKTRDEILQKLAEKKVLVNLADGTTTEANVSWTIPDTYNASILTEQKITATGTISLPEYVDGAGINTTVTADVYVAGAERVKTPTASVDSGIYTDTFDVTLSTDTKDATIYYYITDGTDSTTAEGKAIPYTGSPISIGEGTKTLTAYAVRDGMQASPILSCTYQVYVHTHVDTNNDGKCDGIFKGEYDSDNNKILEPCDTVFLGRSNDTANATDSVQGKIVQDDGKGTIYVKVDGKDIVEKDETATDDSTSSQAENSGDSQEETKPDPTMNWKYSNDIYPTTKLQYAYKPEGSEETTNHGYIFAGWYKFEDKEVKDADGNITTEKVMTAYDKMPTETAYAKFVDDTVLSVKAQVKAGTTAESEKTNMRFLTNIDTVKYQSIGFKVNYGNKEKIYETSTVYRNVYENGETTIVASEPKKVFGNNISEYFIAYTVKNIPKTAFDMEFTVNPFWVTLDGTKVYGTRAVKKVNDAPELNKNND